MALDNDQIKIIFMFQYMVRLSGAEPLRRRSDPSLMSYEAQYQSISYTNDSLYYSSCMLSLCKIKFDPKIVAW